jgi:cytochrome c oxidase subunit III
MPPITERTDIERKPRLGGGGPGKILYPRGYGGGDDGDFGHEDDFLSSRDRLRRFRVGIAVGIVAVAVLFIGVTTAYLMRPGVRWDVQTHVGYSDWRPLLLPYRLLLLNTFVLALSSLTLEMARKSLLKKTEFTDMGIRPPKFQTELPWLAVTVILGLGFLAGQLAAWNLLRRQGVYLDSNASGSFFYLLTGLHAFHLLGGLIVLAGALAGSWIKMRQDSQRIVVDVTGWYWHFMGILWIYIFAMLHFARNGN